MPGNEETSGRLHHASEPAIVECFTPAAAQSSANSVMKCMRERALSLSARVASSSVVLDRASADMLSGRDSSCTQFPVFVPLTVTRGQQVTRGHQQSPGATNSHPGPPTVTRGHQQSPGTTNGHPEPPTVTPVYQCNGHPGRRRPPHCDPDSPDQRCARGAFRTPLPPATHRTAA